MRPRKMAEIRRRRLARLYAKHMVSVLDMAIPSLNSRLQDAYLVRSDICAIHTYSQLENRLSATSVILESGTTRRTVEDVESIYANPIKGTVLFRDDEMQVPRRGEFRISHDVIQKGAGIELSDVIMRGNAEQHLEGIQRVVYDWLMATTLSELCRLRSARLKEELVAVVWHPRRVAKWLEEGGWDAVEAME